MSGLSIDSDSRFCLTVTWDCWNTWAVGAPMSAKTCFIPHTGTACPLQSNNLQCWKDNLLLLNTNLTLGLLKLYGLPKSEMWVMPQFDCIWTLLWWYMDTCPLLKLLMLPQKLNMSSSLSTFLAWYVIFLLRFHSSLARGPLLHPDAGKKMKEWDMEAGQRGLPIDSPEAQSKKTS